MGQSQLSKDIKKINARIKEFEKAGFKGTRQYKDLMKRAKAIKIREKITTKTGKQRMSTHKSMTKTKSGYHAIKNSSEGYSDEMKSYIHAIAEGNNTLKAAKKHLRDYAKKYHLATDDKNLKRIGRMMDKVHTLIVENTDVIYADATMDSAVHRKTLLTFDEVKRLYELTNAGTIKIKTQADTYTQYAKVITRYGKMDKATSTILNAMKKARSGEIKNFFDKIDEDTANDTQYDKIARIGRVLSGSGASPIAMKGAKVAKKYDDKKKKKKGTK